MMITDCEQMIAEKPVKYSQDFYQKPLCVKEENGLYSDLTYQIIGALYEVHQNLGSVHKEIVYQKAAAMVFREKNIKFVEEAAIPVMFKGQKIGVYRPDFIVEDKVILELKAVPMITKAMLDQIYYYMNGSVFQLVLLANFGTPRLRIKRRIFTL